MTSPEQHAATVREALECPNQDAPMHTETNCTFCAHTADARRALDELAALARNGEGAVIALRESKKMREAAEARADELQRERDFLLSDPDMVAIKEWVEEIREQARREADQLRAALRRAARVAENLMGMIDREAWRATGGDDGQGHYEGDYRAEGVADEIRGWVALAGVQADGGRRFVEPPESLGVESISIDRGERSTTVTLTYATADNKDSA